MTAEEEKNLTDTQKIELINKRVKRMELSTHIQTVLMVAAFLGIMTLAVAADKIKKVIK